MDRRNYRYYSLHVDALMLTAILPDLIPKTRRIRRLLRKLPAALASLSNQRRWVVWRYANPKTGRGKIPINPRTGRPANVTDPRTWSTFAVAEQTYQKGLTGRSRSGKRYTERFDGIGIILGGGLAGLDWDKCVDHDGRVAPRVMEDVLQVASYTEYSPSGTGVKSLALATIPDLKTDYIELYGRPTTGGRFFALTLQPVPGTPDILSHSQAVVDTLSAQWRPTRRVQRESTTTCTERATAEDGETAHFEPEFWRQVIYWRARLYRLIDYRGVPYGASPQLRNFLATGVLPPALAATGDTPSEGRALIVRQLRRPGYAYSDAETYVVARYLWTYHGCNSDKTPKELEDDARRLIRDKYPCNSAELHAATQQRIREYGRQSARSAPSQRPPTRRPAVPRRSTADPEAYLATLQTHQDTDGNVALPRRERAALMGIHEKTAQRLEVALVASGKIRIIIRRTPTGRASIVHLVNAQPLPLEHDVQTPTESLTETQETADSDTQCIGENTGGIVPSGRGVSALDLCSQADVRAPRCCEAGSTVLESLAAPPAPVVPCAGAVENAWQCWSPGGDSCARRGWRNLSSSSSSYVDPGTWAGGFWQGLNASMSCATWMWSRPRPLALLATLLLPVANNATFIDGHVTAWPLQIVPAETEARHNQRKGALGVRRRALHQPDPAVVQGAGVALHEHAVIPRAGAGRRLVRRSSHRSAVAAAIAAILAASREQPKPFCTERGA